VNDRRRLRRDDDTDRDQAPTRPAGRHDNPATAAILDLQSSAGNHAVGQLLQTGAHDPALVPLQREPVDQAPGAEPTDTRTSAGETMTIPELELVMPILSFQQQAGRPNQPKSESGEVVVTLAIEKLDPRIAESVAKGRQFATITIVIGSRSTITLSGVVLSSYSVGSDTATLSLNFTSIVFGQAG
jgi:hypothetical protein